MILIESSHWRLWSDPEQGVQWLAAQVKHKGHWHDVVPDCRTQGAGRLAAAHDETAPGQSAEAPLTAASFHMIPYSNRIRDARFQFQDQSYQLDNAQQHAIHGALRKVPWKVINTSTHLLACEFDSTVHAAINWPWPIHAKIEQQLVDDVLMSTITIRNNGSTDMPVGTGWHPYFVRRVGNDHPILTLPVQSVYPDSNGDCLPVGPAIPLPENLDFRLGRSLDPDQRIDSCLGGLDGTCHIHWQDVGIELLMQASDACRFLVLYNPDMPHFAIEPVTNANDAFNLSTQDIDSGTTVLPAGETFSVTMRLQVKLHP